MSDMVVPEGQTSDEVYDKQHGKPGPTPGQTVDLNEGQNKPPPAPESFKITHSG